MKKLPQTIGEMRNLADLLRPFSHPNVSFAEEYDILPLKCRNIIVDGYSVIVNFSMADYNVPGMITESLQLQSVYASFLPFNLVCKVARAFLGSKFLSYVDFYKEKPNKKIYCWTLRTKYGKPVQPKKYHSRSFENFSYNVLNQGAVSLYEQ